MATPKQWNPIQDTYRSNFNTYQQGPGASLDDNQQPGVIANSGNTKSTFRLCLKNVPKEMTPQALRNLCSGFGKVTDVHTSTRTPYIFMSFATFNDMERVLTGLKDNIYGINADIAKDSKKTPQTSAEVSKDENRNPADTPIPSGVDMSKRSIKGPFTNPPRPHPVRKPPLVTHTDYENSNLIIVDPHKHFLIQNDVYDSDRNKPKPDNPSGGKNMHTGRPYYKEPKETTDYIRKLSEQSKGSYNSQKNEYTNNPNAPVNGVGDCIRCGKPSNKVCQRCEDFYCSLECQKRDWPKHRYICFQMPQLVPPNSSNIGVSLPENSPNLANATKNQTVRPISQVKATHLKEQPSQQVKNQKPEQNGTQNGPQSGPKPNQNQNNNGNNSTANNRQGSEAQEGPVKLPNVPKSLVNADMPPSGSTVAITVISKSNLVYIRSLASEDNVEYIQALNVINTESKKAKFIDKPPKRGDILVTEFQETGFYRVMVLDPNNEKGIAVAYVDFGNMEFKKMSELKYAPPEAYDYKRFAQPIHLKNVKDFQAHEKVLAYLNLFADTTGKELKLVYDNISEGYELIDLATNENINKKILELMDAPIPKDSDPPVMSSDIEMRLLPDGENVPVYVFDNSFLQTGYISCIHESDVLKIEGYNKQIQEYAEKTSETYTPREEEMCLVKYEEDGVWYRAECMEVVGDGNPSVLFIDYGNVTTAKIENIRKFPKELNYPCLTSSCFIKGLPEILDDKAVERLRQLIPINEKIVFDKVVSSPENEVNEVSIEKVIKTLQEDGLI